MGYYQSAASKLSNCQENSLIVSLKAIKRLQYRRGSDLINPSLDQRRESRQLFSIFENAHVLVLGSESANL
jgi:hypothetical protein